MHAKRLKNAALAKVTGVHVTTVSQWLNDKFEPDAKNLDALARLLGVSVAWLRFGEAGPRSEGDVVVISRDDAFYWRGVLDAELRSLRGVGESLDALGQSLQALRGLLSNATTGVGGFIDSGVLPPLDAPVVASSADTDRAAARAAEYDARLAAVAAKRAAEQQGGASRRRAAGH